MSVSRRSFLRGLAAGSAAVPALASAQTGASRPQDPHAGHQMPAPPGAARAGGWNRAPMLPPPGRAPVPVQTPDIPKAAFTLDNGVKVFTLTAEPVKTTFLPGRPVDAWGFNGSMPGPTVEVTEGDRVRFVVQNRLPELFAMHWHGLEVPPEVDGVPGLGMDPIPPGGSATFEFTLHQHGTCFYHSHMPMQEMLGMIGLFVIHPRAAYEPRVHRDFGLIFQGWQILPNNTVPNTLAMEFNWLTINGRSGPATTPMLARAGERVRVRMVNLGMDHHPIHLHGNTFYTVGTEAGRIPSAAWEPGNTVLVGVAQSRDIEFDAVYPGDWMLHCHLPHHMMNQMVTIVGPRGEDGHAHHAAPAPPGADQVPGFPQDMWMVQDDLYRDKPETHGLRPSWTAGMMGMMTMIRVLPLEKWQEIEKLKAGNLAVGNGARP
jgi:FtsP/CotA-like multicopper oxidase with cupredoxin domain